MSFQGTTRADPDGRSLAHPVLIADVGGEAISGIRMERSRLRKPTPSQSEETACRALQQPSKNPAKSPLQVPDTTGAGSGCRGVAGNNSI